MLRKISVALAVFALLVPLLALGQTDKPEPRLIPVHFDSQPAFAEIRVDGVFIGTAPLQYRLAPGVHKIELTRRGFQTWQRELFVSADAPTNVTALLEDHAVKPCGK